MNIEKLIDKLASEKTLNNLHNQYSYDKPINIIRRNNLHIYLNRLLKYEPKILLLGEAAGYRGCRLTGIPFTNKRLLLKGIDDFDILGSQYGHQLPEDSEGIPNEQSATIVWQTIVDYSFLPVLWNSIPFHPHKKDNPNSNRRPSSGDFCFKKKYLDAVLSLFNTVKIIAPIGNKADGFLQNYLKNSGESLKKIYVYKKIRHPANGGKKQFRDGIRELIDFLE